jgi:hypothetical protein
MSEFIIDILRKKGVRSILSETRIGEEEQTNKLVTCVAHSRKWRKLHKLFLLLFRYSRLEVIVRDELRELQKNEPKYYIDAEY